MKESPYRKKKGFLLAVGRPTFRKTERVVLVFLKAMGRESISPLVRISVLKLSSNPLSLNKKTKHDLDGVWTSDLN